MLGFYVPRGVKISPYMTIKLPNTKSTAVPEHLGAGTTPPATLALYSKRRVGIYGLVAGHLISPPIVH